MDSNFISQKPASGLEAKSSCSEGVMLDPSEVTEQTKLLTMDTVMPSPYRDSTRSGNQPNITMVDTEIPPPNRGYVLSENLNNLT